MHNEFKVIPLHVMLPKTSTFVKYYDGQTKWKYFLIEDDDLLKKYNTIWDKGSADIKREFESEPTYNEKCYNHEVTDFYNKEIPNVDSNHSWLVVINLDSALKKDENIIHKYLFL